MSCTPSTNACQPRPFHLFQTCDGGSSVVGCAKNDWEVETKDGKTRVKLDCGYVLEFDEAHSEIVIISPCGKRTCIWGDPHVDVDNIAGQRGHDFGFYGTSTFQLKDGTKITINTEPWKNNPSTTLAENVVVTKGDKSLVVSGLSQNNYNGSTRTGDFKIVVGMNGRELDKAVWDGGFTAIEADGGQWIDSRTGRIVTQADADKSRDTSGNGSSASLAEQLRIAQKCQPETSKKEGYCFTWLEALAAAFGNVLTKQVDKINWIYQNLNACYAVKKGCELSPEDYAKYCDAYKGMTGKDVSGWTSKEVDGKTVWSPSDDAAAEADKGQIYWQQVLTGASQQFTISAQTGMTVQNAISQGMQTVARTN